MMDVMCDTMVVERSKFEEDGNLGQMQVSICYPKSMQKAE